MFPSKVVRNLAQFFILNCKTNPSLLQQQVLSSLSRSSQSLQQNAETIIRFEWRADFIVHCTLGQQIQLETNNQQKLWYTQIKVN